MQQDSPKVAPTLEAALKELAALLVDDPAAAQRYALEALKHVPGQPHVLALLGDAVRLQGDLSAGCGLFAELERAAPKLAAVCYERGRLLRDNGDKVAAAAAFAKTVELEPFHPSAWHCLGDSYAALGNREAGAAAYAKDLEVSLRQVRTLDPSARPAAQTSMAEQDLRDWLVNHATDASAHRTLGILYANQGKFEEAEQQLSAAVELAPEFAGARWLLARLYAKRGQWAKGLPHAEVLLLQDPDDHDCLSYKAEALLNTGQIEPAIACFESLLGNGAKAENWMCYGHALRSARRLADAVAAYRQAIALRPDFGEAYWSLANLKTFKFAQADVEAMLRAIEKGQMTRSSRTQMHFALGKAYEDEKQFAPSFVHYEKGNAEWHKELQRESDPLTGWVARSKAVFTGDFYRERAAMGHLAPDPIFIVGLPRSGSTLIEQILASHSLVEGTGELPVLGEVAEAIADFKRTKGEDYPEMLRDRTARDFLEAGERYMQATQRYRSRGRPFFTDKMPSNFHQLGLLLLILPKAKIIDARRHPMAAGWANFKQFYPEGYGFTFNLADIGRYYCRYVELMAHFDAVLPGRIHRVFLERLVTDTEQEIRRLLEFCDLPFEEACLRFHETDRAILTASSEQVRRPISREGLDQWKNYERWLAPLKTALGDVLDRYPDVPNFGAAGQPYVVQWGGAQTLSAQVIKARPISR